MSNRFKLIPISELRGYSSDSEEENFPPNKQAVVDFVDSVESELLQSIPHSDIVVANYFRNLRQLCRTYIIGLKESTSADNVADNYMLISEDLVMVLQQIDIGMRLLAHGDISASLQPLNLALFLTKCMIGENPLN